MRLDIALIVVGDTLLNLWCGCMNPMRMRRNLMPDILLACANAERIPLADDSVHVVVTSPPYWQQRDYDLDDAGIGLEGTMQDWLEAMSRVSKEIFRVLRPDGVFWCNVGEKYLPDQTLSGMSDALKNRFIADGWYHRSTIIWSKLNPMPESLSGWRWEPCRGKVEAGGTSGDALTTNRLGKGVRLGDQTPAFFSTSA